MPSLKQLNEAIASYRSDHPDDLITVVVDATFGHRIDPKEVPEFEVAIETNEFVAPPAGAVGRGDGFILSIAKKVNATIVSNDSYQEFHGEYPWLFDEGRLIGGKPVPHIGWVFVNRSPVRGPISRRSVKEQKVVDKSPSRGRGQKRGAATATGQAPMTAMHAVSLSAEGPMPIPKAPPPGAVLPGAKAAPAKSSGRSAQPKSERQQQPRRGESTELTPEAAQAAQPKAVNDLLAFLSFVEHHPVGTSVSAVVESYSSHGAYVAIGDVKGYVPLRLMADPAPRSAREIMALNETVTLVVSSFAAARRSIDLAVPAMAPPPADPPKARRAPAKKTAKAAAPIATEPPGATSETPAAPPTQKKSTRSRKAAAAPKSSDAPAAAAAAVVESLEASSEAPTSTRRSPKAAAQSAKAPAKPRAARGGRAAATGAAEAPAATAPSTELFPAPITDAPSAATDNAPAKRSSRRRKAPTGEA